jgi:hypothetical protein
MVEVTKSDLHDQHQCGRSDANHPQRLNLYSHRRKTQVLVQVQVQVQAQGQGQLRLAL